MGLYALVGPAVPVPVPAHRERRAARTAPARQRGHRRGAARRPKGPGGDQRRLVRRARGDAHGLRRARRLRPRRGRAAPVARTRRRASAPAVIDAIGPVWNGNEVWLIAAGGAMVAAFPRLYADELQRLLPRADAGAVAAAAARDRDRVPPPGRLGPVARRVGRGVRRRRARCWRCCSASRVGNVLRGLPLDAEGQFRGSFALMLNPFAVLAGLVSVAVLALHGGSWIALKTEGELQQRARRLARRLWWAAVALVLAFVAASFAVRPDFTANFARWPWLVAFPAAAAACLLATPFTQARRDDRRAFLLRLRCDRLPARLGRRRPVPGAAAGAPRERAPRPRRVQRRVACREPAHRARRLRVRDGDRDHVHGQRVPRLARQGPGARVPPLSGGRAPPAQRAEPGRFAPGRRSANMTPCRPRA